MKELSKQNRELILNHIFREYDLPVEKYIESISIDSQQRGLLQQWFKQIYCDSLAEPNDDDINHFDLPELMVTQRWAIERGDYTKALKAFTLLAPHLNDVDEQLRNWCFFWAGKVHQHMGEIEFADFFYKKITCLDNDKTLFIYVEVEKAYLAYHNNQYKKCYSIIRSLEKHHLIENKWLHIKVLCNVAMFLFLFGEMRDAQKYLTFILSQEHIPKSYQHRSSLYLFQILVETHQWQKAVHMVSQLTPIFYKQESDYKFSFCHHWIILLKHTKQFDLAAKIISEMNSEFLPTAVFSHQISYWADCFELPLSRILELSRLSRSKKDFYSRYYLWLKQIRMNHLSIRSRRRESILRLAARFFLSECLFFDLKQAETLLIKFGNQKIHLHWIDEIIQLGQHYLLNDLCQSSTLGEVFVIHRKSNTIRSASIGTVQLGKDVNSIAILECLEKGINSIGEIIHLVFGDTEVTPYSEDKLRIAIRRLNKRLGVASFVLISKDKINLSSANILMTIKDD